jgi:3-hydroxyacyl-CoA dehydrogenase
VRLAIAEYLHATLGRRQYEPPKILREKVKKGELGGKWKRGSTRGKQSSRCRRGVCHDGTRVLLVKALRGSRIDRDGLAV